eukprot:CAMPEP_0179354064 /NCGR_PEP_ID=MMETSP0797-20121207/76653_1 /TAXON_ID=47934 /ORGANISM="Dinophysis acuminata, Strain DAEP01" /LENGTH=69 /DNA_ID=CAMNT_0021069145 /DNA_START=57 /DNA_END=262 /DNA_ORIENTATION=+
MQRPRGDVNPVSRRHVDRLAVDVEEVRGAVEHVQDDVHLVPVHGQLARDRRHEAGRCEAGATGVLVDLG